MPSRKIVNDTIKAGNRAQLPTAEEVIASRAARRDEVRARRRRLAVSVKALALGALAAIPALALRLCLSTWFQLLALTAFFTLKGQPIAAGLCALAVVVADSGQRIAGEIKAHSFRQKILTDQVRGDIRVNAVDLEDAIESLEEAFRGVSERSWR